MSTLIMKNFDKNGAKAIVFAPDGKPRPVAGIDNSGVTEQCLMLGDTVLSTSPNIEGIQYHTHGSKKALNEKGLYEKLLNNDLYQFLKNTEKTIPTFDGWDGVNTINDLAFKYGLDKFLIGIPNVAILGGIMGIGTDFENPSVGSFDINKVLNNKPLKIAKTDMPQLCKLLAGVDLDYSKWLLDDCISSPVKTLNWRSAERLPTMLSVSCIMNKGKPVRFNDLIVWRDNGDEPEVISIFDIVKTFTMEKTNFLSMPYVIDENVTRVMYVVHGEDLTCDGNNVAWLYRRR